MESSGKPPQPSDDEHLARGSHLWKKQNVTISGERVAKVDRVAAQIAMLVVDMRSEGVPVHNIVCLSEYMAWVRRLCTLADTYISSKPVGVGIVFTVDQHNTAIVESIAPGSPAADSGIRVGDALWKINGRDVYRRDFHDMADLFLGREGTELSLVMKRRNVPQPITAVLRRGVPHPDASQALRCDLHPWEILNRVRLVEVSLLELRFELEEWALADPAGRVASLEWHRSVVQNHTQRLNHRCLRLAQDLGLDVRARLETDIQYDRRHSIRDPFAQMVWRGYLGSRPVVRVKEWIQAIQNELRRQGFNLLSPSQASVMWGLMGVLSEDSISAIDVQSFVDRWNPPARHGEAAGWPWPEAGHGLMDALRLAEANLLGDLAAAGAPLAVPEWFRPALGYQEACYLLSTADTGTYVVRYSTTPGDFAIQWCSPGRQIKCGRVFAVPGGYAWRRPSAIVYPNLARMLREVYAFLRHPLRMPPQRAPIVMDMLSPGDD